MFKFSIKIDDKEHSLTAENGISIDKIGQLLSALYKAIDFDERAKCTLSGIRGNCYALDFSTESESQAKRFEVVHKNIAYLPLEDLEEPQRAYAKVLKPILGGRFYLNAYDGNKNKIASVSEIKSGAITDYYFTEETVYGIVSQLGDKNLTSNKKHIYIDGYDFRITVSSEQDLELKSFYATDKLSLNLKVKRSLANGKEISAELDSFNVVGKNTLSENLENSEYIQLEISKDYTLDSTIDDIYGKEN